MSKKHQDKMNENYKFTRHVYDITRPLFLFGRNSLLEDLNPRLGETICEIGCGTARNLVRLSQRTQNVQLIGLDASTLMLEKASSKLKKNNLEKKIKLYHGMAENYIFEEQIDKFIFPYSLSMIPKPKEALTNIFNQLPPGGSIYILDFGSFKYWPSIVKEPFFGFLNFFQVYPDHEVLNIFEFNKEYKSKVKSKLGGYSYFATLTRGNF